MSAAPLPPLPAPQPLPNYAQTPAGDWKAEAVRGFWRLDPGMIKFIIGVVVFCGLVYFFQTRSDAIADKFFAKLDGHVDALKKRDIELDRQQGERIERVVKTSENTINAVKEMARDAQQSLERAYQQRLIERERQIGVGAAGRP